MKMANPTLTVAPKPTHFSSVFTKDDQSTLPDICNEPVPNITRISVEVDGVCNLLENLDLNKAAGPDNIPT